MAWQDTLQQMQSMGGMEGAAPPAGNPSFGSGNIPFAPGMMRPVDDSSPPAPPSGGRMPGMSPPPSSGGGAPRPGGGGPPQGGQQGQPPIDPMMQMQTLQQLMDALMRSANRSQQQRLQQNPQASSWAGRLQQMQGLTPSGY